MSEQTVEAQAPAGAGKMGPFARFIGIFTSPGRVFEHLKKRPSWLVILVLVMVFSSLQNVLFLNMENGENIVREEITEGIRRSGQTFTDDQIEQFIRFQKILGPIIPLVFFPLVSLILTTVVCLVFNVFLGGEAKFRQVFSLSSHLMPIFIIQFVLVTVLSLMKESSANVSFLAFFPILQEGGFLYWITRFLNIFQIWQVGLLSLGTSILYGFSAAKCSRVLFGIYGVLILFLALLRTFLF